MTALTAANYEFTARGTELLDGRPCYRLQVKPKRKDKLLYVGTIWVDAEDFAVVRIQAGPAKNPSFWTRDVRIVRRYGRVDGVRVPLSLDSTANVVLAGHSTLSIQYQYESINGQPVAETMADAAAR